MSILTKVSHKIFGSLASYGQLGKFGSFKNGSPEYATDIATSESQNVKDIQSTLNFEKGIYEAVVGNGAPLKQDINSALRHSSRQIGYLYQAGIPEWDNETVYYSGSVCTYQGQIYLALLDDFFNKNPASSNGFWKPLLERNVSFDYSFQNGQDDYLAMREILISNKKTDDTSYPISGMNFFSKNSVTFQTGAYRGCVYSPTEKKIYFVPWGQASQAQWHYIDCRTGSIVAYTHGATVVANAYQGGVYDELRNRILFIPADQISQANWHYVNCNTGQVVSYAHGGSTADMSYSGGCISPKNSRLYFACRNSLVFTKFQYLNLNSLTLVDLSSPSAELTAGAYSGAVYSPSQDRIYLMPLYQWGQAKWHYIDCSTGAVVSYDPPASVPAAGTSCFAVFIPEKNKIFIFTGASYDYFYEIDCNVSATVWTKKNTGSALGTSLTIGGACYSPATGFIYFSHATNSGSIDYTESFDSSSETIVILKTGGAVVDSYNGGVYSPHDNSIYMAPSANVSSLARYTEPVKINDERAISCCVFNRN